MIRARIITLGALFTAVLGAHNAPPTVTPIYGGVGVNPQGALLRGPEGVLYGTTAGSTVSSQFAFGTVYELVPPETAGGAWTQNVLHTFSGPGGGASPTGALVMDKSGNLYGTAMYGGTHRAGIVFQLGPPAAPGSARKYRVLHSFPESKGDGYFPEGGVVFGPNGALYGSTYSGGAHGAGAVFELLPPDTVGGGWTETVIYSVSASGYRASSLIADSSGNLYGADLSIFELSPPTTAGGAWTATILVPASQDNYAYSTNNPLAMDAGGNLYGTTTGVPGDPCILAACGTVFEVVRPTLAGGSWTPATLYAFTRTNGDGAYPYGALVIDENGFLYGTTSQGGTEPGNYGTVFRLSPPTTPDGTWSETGVPLGMAEANPGVGLTLAECALYGVAGGAPPANGGAFRVTR